MPWPPELYYISAETDTDGVLSVSTTCPSIARKLLTLFWSPSCILSRGTEVSRVPPFFALCKSSVYHHNIAWHDWSSDRTCPNDTFCILPMTNTVTLGSACRDMVHLHVALWSHSGALHVTQVLKIYQMTHVMRYYRRQKSGDERWKRRFYRYCGIVESVPTSQSDVWYRCSPFWYVHSSLCFNLCCFHEALATTSGITCERGIPIRNHVLMVWQAGSRTS